MKNPSQKLIDEIIEKFSPKKHEVTCSLVDIYEYDEFRTQCNCEKGKIEKELERHLVDLIQLVKNEK